MVAQSFEEMGYDTRRNHEVRTVRGKVKIDVHAVKTTTPIPTVVLCECKHWNKAVEQSVIYGFRSICADVGAHFGLVVSKVGFQSGANQTRESTNIHLLNFSEFQETFFEEWRQGIFLRCAQMMGWLLPLMPGNPTFRNNAELQSKLKGINVFERYEAFFGDHRFSSYFVSGDGEFPITIVDPRGDPREKHSMTITSYRQYFEVNAQACADACRYFHISPT